MDLSFTKATDTAGKVFQIPVTCTKAENKILAVIKKRGYRRRSTDRYSAAIIRYPLRRRLFCRTYAAPQLSYLF